MGDAHKVLIYLGNHSVCPIVRIGTPHQLSRKRVCPSPEPKGGRTHSTWVGPNSDDWRKGIVLCLLCGDAYMSGTSVATWVRGS